MKKITILCVMAMLCLQIKALAQEKVKGRVVDAQSNESLPGAVVKIVGSNNTIVANANGEFEISLANGKYTLQVKYLSYSEKEVSITIPITEVLLIKLNQNTSDLQEVEIVNTGYQNIPKERATGSFTFIDNKTLSRTASPDILSRLKGVSSSLLFDNTVGNTTGISVRGRSTIFSNTTPLIVVDNFPFEGDINTLNPESIESVTILKDAAAASIWGVRAGNGVIVITTKQGKFDQKPAISFKSDYTFSEKPDIYTRPQLSSNEFIDLERFLFDKGKYNSTINNGYSTISPVVEILQKIKLDPSYTSQGNLEIDQFRNLDARDQISKYFYRNSLRQLYHVDAAGGSKNQSYYFSVGYDNNAPHDVALSNDRITLKGSNSYSLLNGKLKLTNDITFSKSNSRNDNSNGYNTLLPYEEIADINGNPRSTLMRSGLREAYTDVAGNGKLLDWKYYPLEELRNANSSFTNSTSDYRVNLSVGYQILDGLNASLSYQYYNASTKTESYHKKDGFYARNRINTLTQINNSTGEVTRPLPYGDIFRPAFISRSANYGRGQLSYNKQFQKHAVNSIVGYEVREDVYKSNSFTLFGYKPETASSVSVDQISRYPVFYNSSQTSIGDEPRQFETLNRSLSYYANASYTFDDKYILSGSFRKDGANIFGVKANQKIIPLWSAGFAWNLHNESFFKDWLSTLQVRMTYGYNGNSNSSVTAYLTASPSFTNQFTRRLFYEIINPPNENLRWEQVQNINLGLNFTTKDRRVSGSLDFYTKNGIDLISTSPIAPQTGISAFIGNTADTYTKGLDFQLNTKVINGEVKWVNDFIFNYAKDEIRDYKVAVGTNNSIVAGNTTNLSPIKGYPINAIFAFPWAGLDNLGNPLGLLNGNQSSDFNSIRNSVDVNQLHFFGSASPTIFGAFRNTFMYKSFELSFNLTYKLNYFFKKPSLNYAALFDGGFFQPDYEKRWQQAGDENKTNVPALLYPVNSNRNDFYRDAAIQVQKGDHIRFQDIQLNYGFEKSKISFLPFNRLNVYMYISNIGIIWRANKHGLDPEQLNTFLRPRTIAFGLKSNF